MPITAAAREGALFTDYYAEASCTAGRANFITGELPIRIGLPAQAPTIAIGRFVFVQQEVEKLAKTAVEFPPMQPSASFNAVKQQVEKAMSSRTGQ